MHVLCFWKIQLQKLNQMTVIISVTKVLKTCLLQIKFLTNSLYLNVMDCYLDDDIYAYYY